MAKEIYDGHQMEIINQKISTVDACMVFLQEDARGILPANVAPYTNIGAKYS